MSHREIPPEELADSHDVPPTRRVQIHLRHVAYAALTIFATAWCYQLHVALGLTATFLAKHILVAIVARALQLPIHDVEGKTL